MLVSQSASVELSKLRRLIRRGGEMPGALPKAWSLATRRPVVAAQPAHRANGSVEAVESVYAVKTDQVIVVPGDDEHVHAFRCFDGLGFIARYGKGRSRQSNHQTSCQRGIHGID